MTAPDDPRDVPATVRAQIERALADAETAFIAAGPPEYQVFVLGGPHDVPFKPSTRPAIADPVHFVVVVVETVLPLYCVTARDRRWPADHLRSVVEGFLDPLIVRTYREKHTKRGATAEEFATTVYAKLRAVPAWLEYQQTLSVLASAITPAAPAPIVTTPPADERRPLTIAEAANRLGVDPATIRRMGKRGDLEILSLPPKLRRVTPAEIDRVLASAKFKRYRRE